MKYKIQKKSEKLSFLHFPRVERQNIISLLFCCCSHKKHDDVENRSCPSFVTRTNGLYFVPSSLLHIFHFVFKERDESFAFGIIMYVTSDIILSWSYHILNFLASLLPPTSLLPFLSQDWWFYIIYIFIFFPFFIYSTYFVPLVFPLQHFFYLITFDLFLIL